MTTLDERYQRGLDTRQRLAGGEGRVFEGSVPSAYELAPDMYRITTESLYGSIWNRPGLDLKHRAIATLTASSVQLATPQVRAHVRIALNVGVTPEEVIEVLMMVAFYGGIPASYNALAITHEVFEERGIASKAAELFDPTVAPATLHEAGLAKHRELTPDVLGYHPAIITSEEEDLDAITHEYLWGAIWTRPGLDIKSRLVCTLASLVVGGYFDLSTRRMIEAALRQGFEKSEIMEIAMQLSLYVGIRHARSFMNIANSVFRSPEFAESGV